MAQANITDLQDVRRSQQERHERLRSSLERVDYILSTFPTVEPGETWVAESIRRAREELEATRRALSNTMATL